MHENIELIRKGYAAWNRGDIEAAVELASVDFEWVAPADLVGARGGRGRDDFGRYLRSFLEVWDDFRCEPEQFWSAGETVLVLVRETGRGKLSGARVYHHLVHVWSFRDGLAVRMEGHVERPDTLERLLPSKANGDPRFRRRPARMYAALAYASPAA
jgi:ketosteroid isomerase-like protein